MAGDDRWRLFSPFELVWAGGPAGRVAGQAVYSWSRGQAAVAGTLARYRERARVRERQREARLAAANRRCAPCRSGAGTRLRPVRARLLHAAGGAQQPRGIVRLPCSALL